MVVLTLAALAVPLVVSYFFLRRDAPPIAGVYRRLGPLSWLKRLVFWALHRRKSQRQVDKGDVGSKAVEADNFSFKDFMEQDPLQGALYFSKERPQRLSASSYNLDRIYFAGTNENGCNIVCSLKRIEGRRAELWLTVQVPEIGYLQHPRHPDVDIYYTDGINFTAGGLMFEMLEPMRTWKVSFSGKLRKAVGNRTGEQDGYVETSFSFIWSAFSQPFDFESDLSVSLMSENVAREPWSYMLNEPKGTCPTHYQQWGELRGRLNVEGFQEQQLYLQCVRDRFCGTKDQAEYHRYLTHSIYLETGMCVQVGVFCQPDSLSHAKVGYVSYPNGDLVSLTKVQLNLWEVGEKNQEPPSSWSFAFVADGKSYVVQATSQKNLPVSYLGPDRSEKVVQIFTNFTVNSVPGRGVSEFFYRNESSRSVNNIPPDVSLVPEAGDDIIKGKKTEITLPFSDLACTASALVGGKGAQLAQLTQIEKQVNATVPPGFCLTLASFEAQLEASNNLVEAIKTVEKTAIADPSSLSRVCEEAVQQITAAEVCPEVQASILESLKTIVGPDDVDFQKSHFAVRSSAAGEDGTEASSAGQMDTILGVVGFPKILEAVSQCWASVYAHQAVEYRRQHGQSIFVSVGVVIQRMVPADAAGVMFTADPVSGSTSVVVVNANFGLGESVVSGRSDPDTIRVERDPTSPYDPARLSMGAVRVGEKRTRIVETGTGGIKEEAITDDTAAVCLDEAMVFKLATLGLELEKRFGSPRDVEWAVVGPDIFMLQCRPITVAEAETEEDLLHEFDSPMTCDYQWMTTSNISEMISGALTPLTLSTFSTSIEYSLQLLLHHVGARCRPTHLSKCLPRICNHLFITLIDVGSIVSHAMMARKDIMEISLLGSFLPEMTLEQIENYAGKSVGLRRFINFVNMMRMWSNASSICKYWEKKIPSYTVGPEAKTAQDLYRCINKQLVDYETVWAWTLINSGRSGNMSTVIMSIIGGDASGWTTEHYGDMALLLSQCNDVYSAEVPHAINSIAQAIAEVGPEEVETFISTPDEECMALLSGKPSIRKMVDEFLMRHGHRCLREAEMREKSWRSAPEKFFSVVKIMLKTKAYNKNERQQESISELLDKMKIKLPFHKKYILKFLLPKAWQAVGAREWGKSLSVQMHEVFKLAYQRLSKFLHEEGWLPDPDLMYFLSHQEIGTLLNTRSARLVIKAQKRRKLLAKQTALQFKQINKSRPSPIDVTMKRATVPDAECLNGMPVSQGQITGPAQVVNSLEGASVIKAGDILVVKSTDVGWSPYFPLIGGLVTELGGLISHGAVVAREYGIPCVVNVSNATSIIKSGETLELDGRAGTVKRLGTSKEASS